MDFAPFFFFTSIFVLLLCFPFSTSQSHRYDESLVRLKLAPMAAAASANHSMLVACLEHTFVNQTLLKLVQTDCASSGEAPQRCSAFLAASHSDRALILAFRSTRTLAQLVAEVWETLFRRRLAHPLGGRVGAYFWRSFDALWNEAGLAKHVATALEDYPDYQIWVTGHSLGGALAALAVAQMAVDGQSRGRELRLATMGAPRTGNGRWARAMAKLPLSGNFRVVHARDPVPHLPPSPFRYQHYPGEVWYPARSGGASPRTTSPAVPLFVLCEDQTGEDRVHCSGALRFASLRLEDHFFYFGKHLLLFGENGCADKDVDV